MLTIENIDAINGKTIGGMVAYNYPSFADDMVYRIILMSDRRTLNAYPNYYITIHRNKSINGKFWTYIELQKAFNDIETKSSIEVDANKIKSYDDFIEYICSYILPID
jgi:homoserine acetyltransferase